MAELLGRKVTISIDSAAVATARTKSLTINNENVDVTSDGDDGIQRFLAEPGQKSVEVSVEGMFDSADVTLVELSLNGSDVTTDIEFDYGTYTIEGTFNMTSYSEGQTYNDAVTFTASFASSGAVTKTPVPPPVPPET
jgi:predicted secreted protein